MKWISMYERAPTIKKNDLVSKDLLFSIHGAVHYGHYHANGCFYDNGSVSAHTTVALKRYQKWDLPKEWCEWWSEIDAEEEPPMDTFNLEHYRA